MPNASAPQSFIPHEVTAIATTARVPGRGMTDLFTLTAVVLLVASAALAAGVFLYGEYLQSSATSKIGQLERAKAAFEPSLIQELTRFDDRMRAAGEVLGRHIAPTAFFAMLEQTTIETVMFSTLNFDTADPRGMTIKMDGVAASVNAIALQADLFSKGGMVTSPIFSDIDRQTDGVHFGLSALLNPVAINFSQRTGAPPSSAAPPSADLSPFSGLAPAEPSEPSQKAPPGE